MTFFISGGAKNGKSTLAQDLTVALAGGGKHYYVATMISTGAEDDDRIRRHIEDRDGMGFETVECFRNILDCLEVADQDGVFLVDSVTAMVQNALFPVEKNYEMDLSAANRCADELVADVTARYPEVVGILLNINEKNTNVILGDGVRASLTYLAVRIRTGKKVLCIIVTESSCVVDIPLVAASSTLYDIVTLFCTCSGFVTV